MSRIYAACEGNSPIKSPPFAERPLKELLDQLKVSQSAKWSQSGPIIVASSNAESVDHKEPGFVQIEVEGHEGGDLGWNGGWHLVHMTPAEAKKRLSLVHQ